MRFLPTTCLFLVACYASHGIDNTDAGLEDVFDAPSFDAPSFDAPSFDAPFDAADALVDADVPDSSEPSVSCRGLRRVDQVRVEWPSADCGNITHPRVTAVSGDEGPFQILGTEFRSCRDRNARLLTRRVGVAGGALRVDVETTVGDVEGIGSIASSGGEYAVCSGTTLHTGSFIEPEPLQPSCMPEAACAGLAYDGAGWGVGWFPGCDGPGELSRARPDGGQRERPVSAGVMRPVVSVASSVSGFGALAELSDLTLFDWPRSAPAPTRHTIEVDGWSGGRSALSAWPFVPGAWAVFTVEETTFRMRVFAASGEVLIDERHDVELPGYDAGLVRATSSPSGAAAVVSYAWSGGRIDSATRLFVFGRDGALVGDELDVDLGADSFLNGADIVMSGSSLLMHRTTGLGEAGEVGATEVLLYDCL